MSDQNQDVEELLAQMQQDAQNAQEVLVTREQALTQQQLSVDLKYSHHYPEMMNKLNDAMGENQEISLNDLMESVGVTKEDFQTLCDENPEMLHSFGGGRMCERLGAQAAKIEGAPHGSCLTGAAEIHSRAGNHSLLSLGLNQDAIAFKKERPYQDANGGEIGYLILDKTGDYITVSMKNPCYGASNERHTPEYDKMNEFMSGIQPGITMTVDSISDNDIRMLKGNTEGGKFGHIAVSSNREVNGERVWACDGKQTEFNLSRYGENIHLCFPKDCSIPRETAERLTQIAALRRDIEDPQKIGLQLIEPEKVDTTAVCDYATLKLREELQSR